MQWKVETQICESTLNRLGRMRIGKVILHQWNTMWLVLCEYFQVCENSDEGFFSLKGCIPPYHIETF